ncbi:hypothetical protein VDF90_13295, partial [Xanthomonas campestris pv. raphani]|nr:hypothetical protein [Xanthomonas campestris pv. raphani]
MQVRPCKLLGGIHAAKGPATVSGQGPVEMVGAQSLSRAVGNCAARFARSSTHHQRTIWCGVLADCGTVGGMDAAIEP